VPTPPVRLLHTSDVHVGKAPHALVRLRRMVRLAQREERTLILTGDVTEKGTTTQLAQVARVLSPLGDQALVIPGNHDVYGGMGRWGGIIPRAGDRQPFDKLLNEHMGKGWTAAARFPWVVDAGTAVLIGLDSNGNKGLFGAQGTLGPDQLARLREVVAAPHVRDKHAVVLVHHHPIPYRMELADKLGTMLLTDADLLLDILRPLRCVVLHGHKHFSFRGWDRAQGPQPNTKVVGVSALVEPAPEDGDVVYAQRIDIGAGQVRVMPFPVCDAAGFLPRGEVSLSVNRRGRCDGHPALQVQVHGTLHGIPEGTQLKTQIDLCNGAWRAVPGPQDARLQDGTWGWLGVQETTSTDHAIDIDEVFPWDTAPLDSTAHVRVRLSIQTPDLVLHARIVLDRGAHQAQQTGALAPPRR
jgi:hypothetical protein